MTPETRSPGPGRWHYGWAVIGSAAGASAFGGLLGVLRALSYSPPAWGYAATSGFAGAAALALGIKALRRYGSSEPSGLLSLSRRSVKTVFAIAAASQVALVGIYGHLRSFRDVTDFVRVGTSYGRVWGIDPAHLTRLGYDGQFFFFIALRPGSLPAGGFDDVAMRYGRILYPALTFMASAGRPALVPWALLAVNVVAISLTVVLLSRVLSRPGMHPGLAWLPVVFAGETLPLFRDLSDPLAVLWIALAIWGVSSRRWAVVTAACALGMLTRETMLGVIVAVATYLVVDGRRWDAARHVVLALLPFATWRLLLLFWLGSPGITENIHAQFGDFNSDALTLLAFDLVFGLIPTLVLGALAVMRLRDKESRVDPLQLVAAICALGFVALFILKPRDHWADPWGALRDAAPVVVLMPVLIAHSRVSAYAKVAITLMIVATPLFLIAARS